MSCTGPLASVNSRISLSGSWLPIAPSETHLEQAIKLANDSKYYEANLALKSIEDSVTIDSISFSDLPKPPKSAKNTT
jgi:hypothetical protein